MIEEKSQTKDAEDAVVLEQATGEVDLEDVYFSYEPDQKLIEKLEFVGKTGTESCYCRTDRLWKDDTHQSADALL